MKTLRIIKKSEENDSCAVVAVEKPVGFTTAQELVCLMSVTPDSQAGDIMQLPTKMKIILSDKEIADGELQWGRIQSM